MFLADTLGNLFFAGTMVGAIGWAAVILHVMGYIDLPKKK
tara:strand:- start:3106 stop:3225 length:120 start_codon:yes stop_codon:yes gene_type:complete